MSLTIMISLITKFFFDFIFSDYIMKNSEHTYEQLFFVFGYIISI